MQLLEAALGRSLERDGRVVHVVAEPGVGKSRLCYEFLQRCRAAGLAVHEARCVAHGKVIPFLPVLEILRGYFGIAERDGEDDSRRKIAGTALLLDPQMIESLPLLLDFLGVPDLERPLPAMDAEVRQRQLELLLNNLLTARSRREPAVLLIEDLHWIDAGSETFLPCIVRAAAGARILVIVNSRPEYAAGWMPPQHGHQLELHPLEAAAASELLSELLGSDPSVVPVAEHVAARTGGNPFFIEEVVQSLLECGSLVGARGAYRLVRALEDVPIPATVQAVLAARIDRLPETEKDVLQTAAVIGKTAAEPVLARVLNARHVPGTPSIDVAAALRTLVAAEFLYEEAAYPEAVYRFKHPLTQEVAYRSQLTAHRARLHATVAEVIAALYPDRLDERAALLAHHWEGAGELLEAARWGRRAAERMRRTNLAEALRHWTDVRELATRAPQTSEADELALAACIEMLELGWRLGISAEEAAALFAVGDALATRAVNVRALAMLMNVYRVVCSHFGGAADFVQRSLQAVQLALQTDDAGLQLATHSRLVTALRSHGKLEPALTLAERLIAAPPQNVRLGSTILGYSPYFRLLRERATLLIDVGRLEEGARDLERAARLAREYGDDEILGLTHVEYATLARVRGEADTALAHAREAMRVADKLGSPFFRAGACLAFGHAHILATNWPEALGALEAALAIARAGHAGVETEGLALAWLAAAHLGSGDVPAARNMADQALHTAVQRQTLFVECVAQIGRARVMLRSDGASQAASIEDVLASALRLIEETGARSHEPFVRVELARLAAATGDARRRRRELELAHGLFVQMGALPRAARVERELKAMVSPA